jgi:hypothetical protein
MLVSFNGARKAGAGLLVMMLLCALWPVGAPGVAEAATSAAATVTVRVEGLKETKLPPTVVTTSATPVVRPGEPESHSCPGTSALGALQLATGGNWDGTWDAKYDQYEIFSIEGESHPFAESPYYWELWVNHRVALLGACEQQLEAGDEVLWAVGCYSEELGVCPGEATPLGVEVAPTANVGEPVSVIVKQYNGEGVPTPAVGAQLTGGGAGAVTDSQGHATVTFPTAGTFLLAVTGSATGPAAIRTEADVCVHNGNDGTCGTTAPTSSPTPSVAKAPTTPAIYTGPYAVVAQVTGLLEGHHYSARHAPRVLTGRVSAPTAVAEVRLRLTRTVATRRGAPSCSYYNGTTDRFQSMRCGAAHGRYFAAGDQATFSYLLPSALSPGRYVLDVQASDLAGSVTKLARGSSRIVFYVV